MIWNDDTEKTTGIIREKEKGILKITYVEIVLCKNCKYYPNGDGSTKWLPCREIITPPGWYCADGERKSTE